MVGTVTANIVNLPWDVALKEIMNANGYDVTVNPDGVIVVDTFEAIAARQSTIPLITRNVRLNYARAVSAAPMVKERLTRSCAGRRRSAPASSGIAPSGAARTGRRRRRRSPAPALQSLTCPHARHRHGRHDHQQHQHHRRAGGAAGARGRTHAASIIRQPQVNIRAKIILVDRSTLEGLGLRYDLGSQQQFFNDLVPRLDSTRHAAHDRRADPPRRQHHLGDRQRDGARSERGAAARLLHGAWATSTSRRSSRRCRRTRCSTCRRSRVRRVLNNRTANLTAGTQVPIRIIDAGSRVGQHGQRAARHRRFQQTGVILIVTPQITNNRQVQMKVHVENSDVQFQANDVGAVFPKQSVDNEVLVADGETTVMGGLTQTTVNVTPHRPSDSRRPCRSSAGCSA